MAVVQAILSACQLRGHQAQEAAALVGETTAKEERDHLAQVHKAGVPALQAASAGQGLAKVLRLVARASVPLQAQAAAIPSGVQVAVPAGCRPRRLAAALGRLLALVLVLVAKAGRLVLRAGASRLLAILSVAAASLRRIRCHRTRAVAQAAKVASQALIQAAAGLAHPSQAAVVLVVAAVLIKAALAAEIFLARLALPQQQEDGRAHPPALAIARGPSRAAAVSAMLSVAVVRHPRTPMATPVGRRVEAISAATRRLREDRIDRIERQAPRQQDLVAEVRRGKAMPSCFGSSVTWALHRRTDSRWL